MKKKFEEYTNKLQQALSFNIIDKLQLLVEALYVAWENNQTVFICGNGGSAANAMHLANDLNYAVDKIAGMGLKVDALPANQSVITSVANDEGYDKIFSQQIKVKAKSGDVLLVFSGSGNSPNVIDAINVANAMNIKTFAVLGFSGGKCKQIAHTSIHFPINDMQVVEDMQMIIGHMCMQWLSEKRRIFTN